MGKKSLFVVKVFWVFGDSQNGKHCRNVGSVRFFAFCFFDKRLEIRTQQELTPCESSFLPCFFWISFVKGDFKKRIF